MLSLLGSPDIGIPLDLSLLVPDLDIPNSLFSICLMQHKYLLSCVSSSQAKVNRSDRSSLNLNSIAMPPFLWYQRMKRGIGNKENENEGEWII